MKALVVNFKIICKDGLYTVEENLRDVKVLFDENMCIDPKSGFLQYFQSIIDKYIRTTITEHNLYVISSEITSLLLRIYSMGDLFIGEMYDFMKNKNGMILLNNTRYEDALAYKKNVLWDDVTFWGETNYCDDRRKFEVIDE